MTRSLLALALFTACADLEPELEATDQSARVTPPGPPDACELVHRNRYGLCCAYIEAGCPFPPGVCEIPEPFVCVKYYCGPTPADWPLVCRAPE